MYSVSIYCAFSKITDIQRVRVSLISFYGHEYFENWFPDIQPLIVVSRLDTLIN